MPDFPEEFLPNDVMYASKMNEVLTAIKKARDMSGLGGIRVTNNYSGMNLSANNKPNPQSVGNTTVMGCNLGDESMSYLSLACIKGSIDWEEDEIEKPLIYEVSPGNTGDSNVYGILMELIEEDGGTGNVVVSGLTHAIVKGNAVKDKAGPGAGEFLEFSDSGIFDVVWASEEVTSQLRLCIISIGTGGSGSTDIPRVGQLPSIPESGKGEVRWDSSLPPHTGDNQLWVCYAGDTKWTPSQRSTLNSGEPG